MTAVVTRPETGSDRALDTRFRTVLARLDRAGRLLKVRRPLSTVHEIAGAMRQRDGDKAMLFEATGYATPLVGNVFASTRNCEVAFGLDNAGLRQAMARGLTAPIEPRTVDKPASQEIVRTSGIDLEHDLPVLWHAPDDGGKFLTAGVVIVRDPVTGIHNASFHRMQLLGGDRTAIKLDYGRHLRLAHERARALGKPLPIAVCFGPDAALVFAAAFMGSQMPAEADELAAAGGLMSGPLGIARAVSQDIVVSADAEIVIEGEVSPTEMVHEGPFGEFVGYLSDAGPAPVFRATAITTRRDPVYHVINGAGRETVMLRKYALEASALRALQTAVPIVRDVEMSPGGLHRFHLVIQVRKESPQHDGLQRNAMLAAFAALKDVDLVTVVDDDIDIHDPVDVEYAVATRMEASKDLILVPAARGHEYVRVSDRGMRTKLGIDATVPFAERARFERVRFKDVPLEDTDLDSAPDGRFG